GGPNVVARGVGVARVTHRRAGYGARAHTVVVHNGSHAHDAAAYLTDRLTGAAIAGGLGGP
ncbi:hypothetical protein ACFWIZ_55095, partial [Streptomyces sp. NPDC127044]